MMSLPTTPPLHAQALFHYDQLPELPGVKGRPNPGVAGAFAGVSHGALLVAGGANFPNGYPWENGTKVWQSAIYLLAQPGQSADWQVVGELKKPLAYGASAVWKERLLCVGGNNATQRSAEVFAMTWDATARQVRFDLLPDLPQPLANLSAAVLGNDLYVFGGESSQGPVRSLYALNLETPQKGWQHLAELPGLARGYSALVALSQPESPGLFVLGGRQTVDNQTTVFGDAYQYHPAQNSWTRLPDLPVAIAAHQAAALGTNRLVILGGDDGTRLRQIEALNSQIMQQPNDPEKANRIAQRNDLQIKHPGFRREIWQYETATKRWSVLGTLPFPAPVTTTAVHWGKSFILPSGEVSPGIRTPAIQLIKPINAHD
ncbi:hypothetical protein GCM10027341_29220 [Spirosoma knui]